MSIADLIQRMKRYEKNAEMIFDAEEPIGRPTDLVMPRRRWFRKPAPNSLEAEVAVAGGADPGLMEKHHESRGRRPRLQPKILEASKWK